MAERSAPAPADLSRSAVDLPQLRSSRPFDPHRSDQRGDRDVTSVLSLLNEVAARIRVMEQRGGADGRVQMALQAAADAVQLASLEIGSYLT